MSFVERLALIILTVCSFILILDKRNQIFAYFGRQKQKFQVLKSTLSSMDVGSIQTDQYKSTENQLSKFFLSLAPTSTADDDGKYSEALKWALHEDDVLNIAITGPYGAGKTSVLKTFFLKHKYCSLNVSLAKFSQSHDSDDDREQNDQQANGLEPDEQATQNSVSNNLSTDYSDDTSGFLLEKSILQQILYAEEQKKLPYSRFARVYHYNIFNKLSLAIPFLLFVSIVFLYSFENTWFKASLNIINSSPPWIFLPAYTFVLLAIIWLLISMFDFLRNLTIEKFNLFSGDFQFSESQGASALNIHLDELIYFFEVTDYRIVVFEDLDRFSNTSIFTKLREMNTLINNSQQVRKKSGWFKRLFRIAHNPEPVRFIYAVKDELFSDSMDRTKFFDFVLPIIPYVSHQNSRQLLMDKLKDIGKLKDESESLRWKEFVRDITLYVDDMRLLTNIFNEFLIYEAKLLGGFKKTDSRMLFAFILYKNKYPKDFSDLYKGQGYIQSAFSNKRTLISQKIKSAESKIKALELEIEEIKAEPLKSLKELRTLILGSIIHTVKANPLQIHNGSSWESAKVYFDSEEKFESLLTQGAIHLQKGNAQFDLNSNDIFGSDWKDEYKRRKKLLVQDNKQKIVSHKQDIERLNKKQQELRLSSLAQLLEDSELDSDKVFEFDGSLLELLIRKGYIDENFSHYLNFFHDGDLSRADKDFVFSIKSKNPLPHENQIQNVEVVLEELDEADFKVEAILNYQLIEHLLSVNQEDRRLTHVFKALSEDHVKYAKFIEDFLITSIRRGEFAVQLARAWTGFWIIACDSLNDSHMKSELANELICYLDIKELQAINIEESFSFYIGKNIAIFTDFKAIKKEKVVELITEIGVVFDDLPDFLKLYPSLIDTILDFHAFEIDVKNLHVLYKILSRNDDTGVPNYTELTLLDDRIDAYLRENIREYLVNYLLKVDGVTESQEAMVMFLQDLNVDESVKHCLIGKVKFQVADIDLIQDKSLWRLLLEYKRVKPSWRNVLIIFGNDDESYAQTFNFLEENSDDLCKQKLDEKIYNEELGYSHELNEFFLPVISSDLISLTTIDKLLNLHDYYLTDIDFSNLSEEVVKLLVERKYIEMTSVHIEQISLISTEYTIKFIENNVTEFSQLDEFPTLNRAVLLGLVASENLSDSDVLLILNSQFSESSNPNLTDEQSREIYVSLSKRSGLVLPVETLEALLAALSVFSLRLKLLGEKLPSLSGEEISICLNAIGLEKLADAYKMGSNAAVSAELVSEGFLESLKQHGYISTYSLKKKKYRIYFFGR